MKAGRSRAWASALAWCCALVLATCASPQQQQKPTGTSPAAYAVGVQRASEPYVIDAATPDVVPTFVKPSPLTSLSISPYAALKARIDSLIPDDLFPPGHIGVKIVSLTRNELLYELNARALFNPGSGQKLITAATALTRLGGAFPLKTVVYVNPFTSTLYIKGFGDPLFRTRDADSLARRVRLMISPEQPWRVVGDASYFDDEYWGYGWNWNDEPEAYQMFITSLILNGNAITLFAKPGRRVGDPLIVRTEPVTTFVTIENNGKTTARGITVRLKLSRKWRERSNVLTVEGEMMRRQREDSTQLSLWQPERYATHVFAECLQKYGVNVAETALDTVPPGAVEVMHISHSIDSVIVHLNKESDNLSGEALLKVLAAEIKGKPGRARAGATVVKEYLAGLGIDTVWLRVADGSGLSRHNLISPEILVRVLQDMYSSPHFESFYNSLPVAGTDGTIRRRMRYTPAHGIVRAKTGTLSGVSSLSGYTHTLDGEWIAFSIMTMNYPAEARVYRRVQDEIAVFLSNLSIRR
ncbi:MAG TPA: D-alanyl-D-alanine carboxypeptidase/D-alanyl-D-alanine-endopeptidase [Bacteroidota bacterium]|nr:D-alanyl-D-alanine carboxypeptidase/D-alanyl-D-alanine-endopeptidase [Bacteroidota bacterium]